MMNKQDQAAMIAAVLTLICKTNLHQQGLELSMKAAENILNAVTPLGELLISTLDRVTILEDQLGLHVEATQTLVRRIADLEADAARSWR